jgi:hypothetical protein
MSLQKLIMARPILQALTGWAHLYSEILKAGKEKPFIEQVLDYSRKNQRFHGP